jgi:probable HAF family extracellular repeat protein
MNRTFRGAAVVTAAGVGISAVLTGTALADSPPPTGVTITDLGTLGTFSTAVEINDSGQVVGDSLLSQSGPRRPFLWEGGVLSDLVPTAGAAESGGASGINNSGQVAYWLGDNAFLWDDGVATNLGRLHPELEYASTRPTDINDVGQVVGESLGQVGWEPFLWDSGTLSPVPVGGRGASATAINEGGRVVGETQPEGIGYSWQPGTAPTTGIGLSGGRNFVIDVNDSGLLVGHGLDDAFQRHAFAWQPGSASATDLGTLGGSESAPADVNNRGQVVGSSTTATGEDRAFLWQDGVMTDLGTLGGVASDATAVNEQGQVVGTSTTATGERHAFLWQNGVMTDLGTLGGTASAAVDINERGEVVGSSTTAGGETRAVLWRTTVEVLIPGFDALSALIEQHRAEGSISASTAAGLQDRVLHAKRQAELGREQYAVTYLQHVIARTQNQVRDAGARAAIITGTQALIAAVGFYDSVE